jgi:hypothetical protein
MRQRQLGELVIARILEMNAPDFEPYGFFPETTPEDWAPHLHWLKPAASPFVLRQPVFSHAELCHSHTPSQHSGGWLCRQ